MALNIHNAIRGAIDALNPVFTGTWRRSTGYTTASNGVQSPTDADTTVTMRVQALSGSDLKHESFLNMQGVKRSVYLYGDVQGVVRPEAKGGDILRFPEARGGADSDWLVVVVFETWTPDVSGWCKIGCVLQGPSPL